MINPNGKIERIGDSAYFVIDTGTYTARVLSYDPIRSLQTIAATDEPTDEIEESPVEPESGPTLEE